MKKFKRMVGIALCVLMLFQLIPVYAENDFLTPKDILDSASSWGIQEKEDFDSGDTAQYVYHPDSYITMPISEKYGYTYSRHAGTAASDTLNGLNQFNGSVALTVNGYKGDFAVTFDMFLADDPEIENGRYKNIASAVENSSDDLLFSVFAGKPCTSDPSSHRNGNDAVSALAFRWKNTITDDNGVAFPATNARASRKYGITTAVDYPTDSDESYKDTAYLNVCVIVENDVLRTYYKWNGSDNWHNDTTPLTLTDKNVVNKIDIATKPVLGFDNYKLYRRKTDIVKAPQEFSYGDLIDDDADNMIVNPHFGTPVFTEPGAVFTAEFTNNTNTDFSKGSLEVYLENEYYSWSAEVGTPVKGNVYLGTKEGWKLDINVPESISPELMNLYIKHTSDDGTVTEYFAPQSVSVVDELNSDFYTFSISDTHLMAYGAPENKYHMGKTLNAINDMLTIGGVRYLTHTGDLIDLSTVDRQGAMKELLVRGFENAQTPLIVTAGNHEYDTYSWPTTTQNRNENLKLITTDEFYENKDAYISLDKIKTDEFQVKNNFTDEAFDRFFGQKTALISMGDDMIIAKNDFGAWKTITGDDSVFIKLRNSLTDKWNEYSDDVYRVIYQHSDDTGDEGGSTLVYGAAAFMSPTYHKTDSNGNKIKDYDIQYTGHYHAVYPVSSKILTLGASGDDKCNWSDEGVFSNYTYCANSSAKKWKNSVTELLKQYGKFDEITGKGEHDENNIDKFYTHTMDEYVMQTKKLEQTFFNPNDGTAEYNIATINNKFDFNFYNGRVIFVMKNGNYTVTNGTVLSQYNSYDDDKTIVVAKVNIPKGSIDSPTILDVVCKPTDGITDKEVILRGAETGFVDSDISYLDLVSTDGGSGDISLTTAGVNAAVSVTEQNSLTRRITFVEPLIPNAKYTLNAEGKAFEFISLPNDGISFSTKNKTEYEGITYGYALSYTTSSTPKDVGDYALTTVVDGVEKSPGDFLYENYVLDYTVGLPSCTYIPDFRHEPAEQKHTRFDWFIYSENDDGKTIGIRPADLRFGRNTDALNQTGFGCPVIQGAEYKTKNNGYIYLKSSILTKPLKRDWECAYDFRVVKLGNTWTLYAKQINDDRFDVVFSLNGNDYDIYDSKGYTAIYFSGQGSYSYWKDYTLYPIDNKAVLDEKVGSEFDITFGVQPVGNTLSLNGNEVADMTLKKNNTFKVKMPDSWNKNSEKQTISGVKDIYGNMMDDIQLVPAETEITLSDIKYIQNGTETSVPTAGDITVLLKGFKNYPVLGKAKIICAVYNENMLVDTNMISAENLTYSGDSLEINVSSDVDNPEIKLFVWDIDTLTPLSK